MVVIRDRPPPLSPPPAPPPAMDPKIWTLLPDHLLDLALSFLPLKNFLTLTSTCKRFKTLISSPQFVTKHTFSTSSLNSLSSFLLLSHPQLRHQFPLFDTTLTSWRRIALPLCPPLSCARSGGLLLLSVSRGLLCFSLPHYSSFLISSLVSRSSKIIKFPTYDCKFDLVTLVLSPIGFKIFLLCSTSGSSNHAYVFDSISNSWKKSVSIGSILSDNYHQEGVFYNGFLYFITPEPFSIIFFDLETGNWGNETIPLPNELSFARLVSGGDGKLYLVGGIGQHGISRSIRIWEMGENWVEIEVLPDMICKKFMSICYHKYEHVYCFWHQGLICVCCYNYPEVLYYKVSRRTWHWLPKNPALPDKWSFGFRWFSLVPELHTFI